MSVIDELPDQLYEGVRSYLADKFGQDRETELHRWLVYYKDDPSFLNQVYRLICSSSLADSMDETHSINDDARGFSYQVVKDELIVRASEQEASVPVQDAASALQIMIDACESYLPLGSIVDLDKDLLSGAVEPASMGNFRVVISQRMAAVPGVPLYFNYGATVYPVGTFKGCRSIYFTPDLIKDVIYVGFSDDTEKAYIAALKTELLFKRNLSSYTFGIKEDRKRARDEVAAQE